MAGGGQYVIGIDLGTTYSCAAVWRNGRMEVIENEQGHRVTPSCVCFNGSELLVGDGAKNWSIKNPENTIFDAKRLIGRRYSDENVQLDKKYWPFKVVAGENDRPTIKVQFEGKEKHQAPEEISAIVLSKIKTDAEMFLGSPVKKAVLTVPAYFNNSQREATKAAGTIAGLDVIHILNEPTAAALAYGNTNTLRGGGERRVLIFDLGGGTSDVSLLNIDEHGVFEVMATAGDTHLGGEDFDNRIVEYCLQVFQRIYNVEVSGNAKALGRLRRECETAKRMLSFSMVTDVVVDGFYNGIDLEIPISRAKLEELNSDLFDRCLRLVIMCLEDAKVGKDSVDEVVLVGGSTRIPRIRAMVEEFFNGKKLDCSINPDEAVAVGAAIQAALLLTDLDGNREEIDYVLIDKSPLSLGLKNFKGIMKVVVPRNTAIPCEEIQTWETICDNQTEVRFSIYEGERAMACDNNLLGEFRLHGLRKAPKGEIKFLVVFHIDRDCILRVSAINKDNQDRGSITITADKLTLNNDQISKMIRDAKRYKFEDKRRVETVSAKHKTKEYANGITRLMREARVRSRLNREQISKVESAVKEAEAWMSSNDNAQHYEYDCPMEIMKKVWVPVQKELQSAGIRGLEIE